MSGDPGCDDKGVAAEQQGAPARQPATEGTAQGPVREAAAVPSERQAGGGSAPGASSGTGAPGGGEPTGAAADRPAGAGSGGNGESGGNVGACPDTGSAAQQGAPPARQPNRTVRGMILSLVVIGIAVAVIYMFIPHNDKADPVQRVDYRVELLTARRAAPYPVAAPVGLPHRWKATSVTYDQGAGHAWHLGFLDPGGQYVAVEQSTSPAKQYAANVSQNAKDTGKTEQVAGHAWQRWQGSHYNALVRMDGDATTVVTGTASYKDLTAMAAALQFKKTVV
jgi:Protein of unknown function (DUF4245)